MKVIVVKGMSAGQTILMDALNKFGVEFTSIANPPKPPEKEILVAFDEFDEFEPTPVEYLIRNSRDLSNDAIKTELCKRQDAFRGGNKKKGGRTKYRRK